MTLWKKTSGKIRCILADGLFIKYKEVMKKMLRRRRHEERRQDGYWYFTPHVHLCPGLQLPWSLLMWQTIYIYMRGVSQLGFL